MVSLSPNFLRLLMVFVISGGLLFFNVFSSPIVVFIFIVSGWLVSLCLHEFGHAYAAWRSGDRAITQMGYLSFDLMKYIQPQFSLLMPVVILVLGGFGMPGGAVYVNTSMIRNPRQRSAVSAAGPVATLMFLVFMMVPMWLGLDNYVGSDLFWGSWNYLARIEVTALIFNLLPVPGLDGYGIIEPFMSYDTQASMWYAKGYGPWILLMAMMFIPPVNTVYWYVVELLSDIVGIDDALAGIGFTNFFFWRFF
ncbi:MAG: site-2 protease family protein [Methylobacteriaceae bacterium]|jgi:Zn-dependent protease|nr:site-2 protease family protein [Methylobacteriaceae bacterium]